MGILLALHVLVTILLILIVLIQKNEGGSSLFASSGSGSMFSARGTSTMLTKATWILASVFLVNCILMATIDSSKIRNAQTIIDPADKLALDTTPKGKAPVSQAPSAPITPKEKKNGK